MAAVVIQVVVDEEIPPMCKALCCINFVDIRVSIVVSVIAVLKISFIECPSVVHGNSNYDDIPIGVHGGLPRG